MKNRADAMFETKKLTAAATDKNTKYFNDPTSDLKGYWDPKTGETFINLAYANDNSKLAEIAIHETEHQNDIYNGLSRQQEEKLVSQYAKTTSNLVDFYHNIGDQENNPLSQITSWSLAHSGFSDLYLDSNLYINNLYGNSTANTSQSDILRNNYVAGGVDRGKVETYQKDVHLNLTEFLAKNAGFSEDKAKALAAADQGTDEDKKTEPFASEWARENYHFTTPERREEMKQDAYETGDLKLFGQYLHAFQDSFSHQNTDVPKTWARSLYDKINLLLDNSPYRPNEGHLPDGEWPDKTYNRPKLADQMAKQSYIEMQKFLDKTGGNPTNNWNSISNKVQEFNRNFNKNENEKGQALSR